MPWTHLVFDNCEHVLDAAAYLIEAILVHSATVRILATSREGLGVPDEQVWPVRSLDAAGGIDSAAMSLFVERAQGITPGFSIVGGDEAAAVTEICQRLDGIPLAIELAASRMASMTASEMRDRLDHRFRLLVGSRRGLERHHTLRHAMAWSYDLLGDTEKTVLDRCSVFAGGFDLQSACAVAGSDDLDEYAILESRKAGEPWNTAMIQASRTNKTPIVRRISGIPCLPGGVRLSAWPPWPVSLQSTSVDFSTPVAGPHRPL